MWGLDFDRHGQLFASTNVGGFVMLHGVQGGYYWKAFGKHGSLHNPYTFGYFDHVRHANLSGGHVSVGGLFYEADALPREWRGRYIAADLLNHSVHGHDIRSLGSTFQARQKEDLLRANDSWFAPTDMTLGPDGRLYIADWHDRRTAHPDPDADWDRSNGRIFSIAASGTKPLSQVDCNLLRKTPDELVALLKEPNIWYRRKARRLLSERHVRPAAIGLRQTALRDQGVSALEALWALNSCADIDDETAKALLKHPDAHVRSWCVRLLGDEPEVSSRVVSWLIELAARETDVSVRAQLACTARRLPRASGLDVVSRLLACEQDVSDPHLPLLLWWAVETHVLADLPDSVARFTSPEAWRSAMCRSAILVNLVRRFAYLKNAEGDSACVRILASAPTAELRQPLLTALDEAIRGREASSVSAELTRTFMELADGDLTNLSLISLAARLKYPRALERARAIVKGVHERVPDQVAMAGLLGEIKDSVSVPLFLDLVTHRERSSNALETAAFGALVRFEDQTIATAILAEYPRQTETWQIQARQVLLSRSSWAWAFLAAVDAGKVSSANLTLEELNRFATLRSPDLATLVSKHWGVMRGETREDKLAEVRRLNNDLRAGPGDLDRGRLLFRDRCAICHRLFGEGENIGPDLSNANRHDRDFLLISLVDPSGVVRKEYQAYQVALSDGRLLSGLVVEETPEAITFRDGKGTRSRVTRSEVLEFKESNVSLMPESLYKDFSPQQMRDLFSFLESEPKRSLKGRP